MGTVAFNTDIDKTVDIDKNVNIDVIKNVQTDIELDGSLASAEASADAIGGRGNGNGNGDGELVQLAFLLDGSGSVAPADFALQVQGLANAVRSIDGFPVEITVIQFSDGAQVENAPTVITNPAEAAALADDIEDGSIVQIGGLTDMAAAINLGVAEITGSANYDPDGAQLINLATDGFPNDPVATQAAADAAMASIDGLSAEAIGPFTDDQFLLGLVFPRPGEIVSGAVPDPLTTGFVLQVDDFGDFGTALEAKIAEILGPGDDIFSIAETETFAQVTAEGSFSFSDALAAIGGNNTDALL